ncbi:tyrosine-type recombinase/integrase [Butyrivibrio sp. DSM 10294]|uniref:tyrosine-type recombinase/integrase n=1 Tax=Butyrivibrio sp. DSM 10294 TaxID=2972457 RepID=UPI00234E63FE|nr:tyrosine-type recombinase/integrase [Butyrivibrio sp. DSM 10294]MDC7294639.1 tyrosine-type recombinase/integrase [Butyrivibrio sp. DSM 10294]
MNQDNKIFSTSLTMVVPTNHNPKHPLNNDEICDRIIYLQRKKAEFLFSAEYDNLTSIADAVVRELEDKIEKLKIQYLENELGKKVAIIKKQNKKLFRVAFTIDGKHSQIAATSVDRLYEKIFGHPIQLGTGYKPDSTLQEVYDLYSKSNHTPIVDNEGNITYPTSTALRKDQAWRKYWEKDIIVTMPIKSIVVGDIIDAFKRLTASRRYTARQISQAKSVLKQTFDHAIWLKLIETNPVVAMPNTSCPKRAASSTKKATNAETREKLENYLSHLPKQTVYTLAIRFWLNIMQRSGEWRALTWEDVNFEKGTIIVRHSLTHREIDGKLVTIDDEHLKADEVIREIEITEKAISILKELYLFNGQKHYVFNSSRDGKLPIAANRLNEKIKEYCKIVGIEPLSTHCQRRGAIQDAYTAGMPEDQIRATAGHSDSTMTRYYNRNNNSTLSKELQTKIFG